MQQRCKPNDVFILSSITNVRKRATLGYLVWRSPIVILLYNLSWSRPSTLVAYEFRTNVQYYCMHDQNPQVP